MLGGLCLHGAAGNMAVGIVGDELMVRVGERRVTSEALGRAARTREMDFTGRPMRGFVLVAPAG